MFVCLETGSHYVALAVLKFTTKTRMAWNSQRSTHLHLLLQVLGLKFCTNTPCRNIPAALLCHGVKPIQGGGLISIKVKLISSLKEQNSRMDTNTHVEFIRVSYRL